MYLEFAVKENSEGMNLVLNAHAIFYTTVRETTDKEEVA